MKTLFNKFLMMALAGGFGLIAEAAAPTMFVDSLDLNVGMISDSKSLADLPVRVVVNEADFPGFDIKRSGGADGDGTDIRFSQDNVILPHELVDIGTETDEEGNEKIVSFTFWVKVPVVKKDSKITMHWGVKDGLRPPANRARDVWSDYYGVWHHAGLTDTKVSDSSGNGLHAQKIQGTDNTESAFEYLAVPGDKLPRFEDKPFAFTANYKAADDLTPIPAATWASAPIVFGTWSSSRNNGYANHQYDTGWGGGWWASSGNQPRLIYRGSSRDTKGDGDDWMSFGNNDTFKHTKPTFVAFNADDVQTLRIYAATDQTALTEGTHRNSQGWITPGEGKMLRLTRYGAYEMTEARLAKVARSSDWLTEEFATIKNPGYVNATGSNHQIAEGEDYWVEYPGLSTLSFSAEDTVTVNLGKDVFGVPSSVKFTSADGRHAYGSIDAIKAENKPGTYRAVFSILNAANGRKPLSKTIYFAFTEPVSSSNLKADQVMIFNDVGGTNPITGQGFTGSNWTKTFDTDPTAERDEEPTENSLLHVKGWLIRFGTIGSALPRGGSVDSFTNYLPYGSDAMSFDDANQSAADLSDAGAAILYNVNDINNPAAVYSPLYESGVGEIYFDAVNEKFAFTNRLELEYLLGDEAKKANPDWTKAIKANLEVQTIKGGAGAPSAVSSNRTYVSLAMKNSANNTSSFYRVKAVLNKNEPVRFRIARVDGNWGAGGLTGPGKILVDNILVCDPPMQIELQRLEETWNPKKDYGKWLLGDRGTLSKPFPKAGDKDVYAKVKVNYAGFGSSESNRSGTVAALVFEYRQRYLNRNLGSAGEWKSLRMVPSASSDEIFITDQPLELPDTAMDIEYRFSYAASPMTFNYYDFYQLGDSALPTPTGISSEIYGDSDGKLVGKFKGTPVLPSRATDFFFRLREGASDYEKLEVIWMLDSEDDSTVVTNTTALHLVDDHVWTGAIAVTNSNADLRFKLRGTKPGAIPGEKVYNYWSFSFDTTLPSPYSDNATLLDPVDEEDHNIPDFKIIPAESVKEARQFIIRFDDGSAEAAGAFSLCRGDYQDFNNWTDVAKVKDDKFVVSAGEAIVAQNTVLQKRYPEDMGENVFSSWQKNVATNELWTERFTLGSWGQRELEGFKSNILYGADGNGVMTIGQGWTGYNFMYVDESLNSTFKESNLSRAVLLMGQGQGSLVCDDQNKGAIFPDGLGEVKFTARIGQDHDYNRVSTYHPDPWDDDFGEDGETFSERNYLVSARVAMSTNATNNAKLGFDGQGTVSVFSYYQENTGSYEFRIKRVSRDTINLGLYRWYNDGSSMKCAKIYSTDRNANGAESDRGQYRASGTALCTMANAQNQAYVVFFDVKTERDDQGNLKNHLYAGFTNNNGNDQTGGNRPNVRSSLIAANESDTSKNKTWLVIGAVDTGSYTKDDGTSVTREPLRGGRFGFLSTDCPACFMRPEVHKNLNATDTINGNTIAYSSAPFALPALREPRLAEYYRDAKKFKDRWSVGLSSSIGCWTVIDEHDNEETYYGIVTPELSQDVVVSVSYEENKTRVKKPLPVQTIHSFEDTEFSIPAYTTQPCYVTISTGRDTDRPRYDVILDNLALTQWHASSEDVSRNDNERFVYHGVWNQPDTRAELWPLRVNNGDVQAIRSPLMNGIGAISFSYDVTTLDENAELAIEVAENISASNVSRYSQDASYQDSSTDGTAHWKLLDTLKYNDLVNAGGSITKYYGSRLPSDAEEGYGSLIRLRVPQSVIEAAHTDWENNKTDVTYSGEYGRIDITSISTWDEPKIEGPAWSAWNLRLAKYNTETENYSEYDKLLLIDSWLNESGSEHGMAMELNNGVDKESLNEKVPELYGAKDPYVQSPSLRNESGTQDFTIGEIRFRARKSGVVNAPAEIQVLGVTKNDTLEEIGTIVIGKDENAWKSYTLVNDRQNIVAVRLSMKDGTLGTKDRVVLDELIVSERVIPTLIFSRVRPFRNYLDSFVEISDIESPDEQPLCDEEWGIQCDVTMQQLGSLIDEDSIRVFCDYHAETYSNNAAFFSRWGRDNWTAPDGTLELLKVETEDGRLVYRTKRFEPGEKREGTTSDFVRAINEPGTVVQYHIYATYKVDGSEKTAVLGTKQWSTPKWYHPVDLNNSGWASSFSAYTILDKVAPKRAWINEVELWNAESYATGNKRDIKSAWVELAIPAGVDMSNWRLEAVSRASTSDSGIKTYLLHTFSGDTAIKGSIGEAAPGYAFYVVANPGERDAEGHIIVKDAEGNPFVADAELQIKNESIYSDNIFKTVDGMRIFSDTQAFALRLVRPTGIVENEIIVSASRATEVVGDSIDNIYDNLTGPKANNSSHMLAVKAKPDVGGDSKSVSQKSVASTEDVSPSSKEACASFDKWTNDWLRTPGAINLGQTIDKDYRIYPHDNTVRLSAIILSPDALTQRLTTEEDFSTDNLGLTTEKGKSITITYQIKPWFIFSSIKKKSVETSQEEDIKDSLVKDGDTYTLTIDNLEESLEIAATAITTPGLDEKIAAGWWSSKEKFTSADENPYADAIRAWMRDKYPGLSVDDIKHVGVFGCDYKLTLTEMYWLGIAPDTVETKKLRLIYNDFTVDDSNLKHTFRFDLYNEDGKSEAFTAFNSTIYGKNSANWNGNTDGVWSGPTLKVMAALNLTGKNGQDLRNEYHPIAYYVVDNDTDKYNYGDYSVTAINPFSNMGVGSIFNWDLYEIGAEGLNCKLRFDDYTEAGMMIKRIEANKSE